MRARPILVLTSALLLIGCGTGDPANDSARADRAAKATVQTATLTGLYEGRSGAEQPNQLCILDQGTGDARFGLVLWGEGDNSCSGDGIAVRQGEMLRLDMAGDEECRIEARIAGTRVTLPASLPEGCAYYCASGARLTAAAFDKVGGTAEDAARARDLVGDPLCG